MNIEQRLSKLEKQNIKLRYMNTISLVLVGMFLITGFQQQFQLPDIIRAKGFVLLDENDKERAVLKIDTTKKSNSPKLRFYDENNVIVTSIGTNRKEGYLSLNNYEDIDSTSIWINGRYFNLMCKGKDKATFGLVEENTLVLHLESINNKNHFQIVQRDSTSSVYTKYKNFVKYSTFYDNKLQENIFYDSINLLDRFINYNGDSFKYNEIIGLDSNRITTSLGDLLGSLFMIDRNGNRICQFGYSPLDGVHSRLSSDKGLINIGEKQLSTQFGIEVEPYTTKEDKYNIFIGHYTQKTEDVLYKEIKNIKHDIEWSGISYEIKEERMINLGFNHVEKWKISNFKSDNGHFINFDLNDSPKIQIIDNNYKTRYSTSLWDDINNFVSTSYYDIDGNLRLSLGNQQIKYENGRQETSPVSTIYFFNQYGNVIEQLPK